MHSRAKNTLVLVSVGVASTWAQTAPQYGQCGGIGWTGVTECPSGWACSVVNPYYSQCLQGAATTPAPTSTVGSSGGSTAVPSTGGSPTSTASGGSSTLLPGNSFIRAVEDPNFHKYLRSEVIGTASDAVLGEPSDASQFVITDGQLVQQVDPLLYAIVEPRANDTVVKLKVTWSETPATSGTFMWSGDTVEWSDPNVERPQDNAWLICPDEDGNKDLYVNLGPYDYNTPPGCADETIHAYTGSTATA
ncbi:hypothetical protein K435DRAFT_749004 [Dendrothele bispora CBS 962.96]|uniref:CBM1 domain-containing protein n=1 Tax=Dendrothele bispora (strain CBS 962.96) TaxID=1314807 RepID=A0A4S8MIR4_DENBC|nr:hypothetical protein K435DRAFT_749004 [Dendrothele bispora CBS 962.96]